MLKIKLAIPVLIILSLTVTADSYSKNKEKIAPVTSVKSSDSDKSPQGNLFTLYQNEPTEMNDVTVIKFDLKKEAGVILNVTDDNGVVYENLIDGEMIPGTYIVLFKSPEKSSLKNMSYTIQVGNFKETRSMKHK
ncbi:MAG TPA: hypothetical protein PKA90_12140 [Ignavibacteria bacterium]|nr:hypothetical protein [Ignavibacteria bacterium]HMR41170.1 hypothetical protein [Ignavibacteria bacterium]